MNFFAKIKETLSDVFNSSKNKIKSTKKPTSSNFVVKAKQKRFSVKKIFKLDLIRNNTWDTFFSAEKENSNFIGFTHRSRRKYRYLYHQSNLLITDAVKTIEVVSHTEIKTIKYKDTLLDDFRPIQANDKAVMLKNKNEVAIININSGDVTMLQFEWQPFSFAMSKHFYLIGTRETYEGPGELNCFDYEGTNKWTIYFNEVIPTFFGPTNFTPYLLDIIPESKNILVSSFDTLYVLDNDGELKVRIAVSDLSQDKLKKQQKKLDELTSKPPKTEQEAVEMALNAFVINFSMSVIQISERYPLKSYVHDPINDLYYLLDVDGKLSAWNSDGTLKWINAFKSPGEYMDWVDNKVVVSFKTGETFWINTNGEFEYGVKLPMQVTSISLIPNKNSYLITCEDHRMYELHKKTSELVKGLEGHQGMLLFQINNQNIFFDGPINKQGYFWLAPPGVEWIHFKAENILDKEKFSSDTTLEIAPTNPFKIYASFNIVDGYYGNRFVDVKKERLYVVERPPQKDVEDIIKMNSSNQRIEKLKSYLKCYDFEGEIMWEKMLISEMRSFFSSPDKETIFTSVPLESEVTFEPGYILIISNEGEVLNKISVDAYGFELKFISNTMGIITFPTIDRKTIKGTIEKNDSDDWVLSIPKKDINNYLFPYGRGLHSFESAQYKLERTDKTKYMLRSKNNELELKLSAAIYQVIETSNKELAFLTGTRLISFYSHDLSKINEIREKVAIQTFASGLNSTAIMTKNMLKGYDLEGTLKWSYRSLPKSTGSITWLDSLEAYIWITSNSSEKIIATINEHGDILKSQSFDGSLYNRDISVSPDNNKFIAHTNNSVEIYEVL